MNERRQSDVELALLRQDVEEMKADMKELKDEVKSLLEAWNTATGLLKFIKWAVGIAAAAATLVAAYKGIKIG